MYTKEQIKKELAKRFNHTINADKLDEFLRICKIDPFVEDKNKINYFDEESLLKLHHGITLAEEGCPKRDITKILNNAVMNPIKKTFTKAEREEKFKTFIAVNQEQQLDATLFSAKIVAEVTKKLLSTMSDSISSRVADDIFDHFKTKSFVDDILKAGKMNRDNELLAEHIENLMKENEKLSRDLMMKNLELSKYKQVAGPLHIKLP